jgi:hypothetical protein
MSKPLTADVVLLRSTVQRLTSVLPRVRGSHARLGLPCAECGAPAIGWSVAAEGGDGIQRIEGSPACALHLRAAGGLPRSKAG